MLVRFLYSDPSFLYVLPVDADDTEPLRVRYNVPKVNDEFAETCALLWRDALLNLEDVTTASDGTLTPAIIILEPDYLIDISALAECFKEYGHQPGNYLLARLRPSENTRPLLLGNIANMFLDRCVFSREMPLYRDCMAEVFRAYPIELSACDDLQDTELEREFFADCERHFHHIARTVFETFTDPAVELNRDDAVLEPSYVCEALGLQGRLDYMQRDLSAFIEMKSGKADEYTHRGEVLPKENNRVQMLLYQAVLQYSMGRDHHTVKAYLLYTRYPLLYPARTSWTTLRRVLDVRNRIVAGEYGISLHNHPDYTAERLSRLTPSLLNERHLTGTLWNRYLAPSIDQLGKLIASLTPLERTYFHTLYTFITRELYFSKMTPPDNPEERVLYGLHLQENRAADAARPTLLLTYTPDALTAPDFRTGDAIVLYERNSEADSMTHRMVFKGNIEALTPNSVLIRLRAAQQNTKVLPLHSLYALEHDRMDTSFRAMYQGLHAFLTANCERRDLLLAQRLPRFEVNEPARVEADDDDFARVIRKARAAKDYFLLIGPPGTGKTSCALRGMVEAFLHDGKQLLLLSYTNRAVDEICKALTHITPVPDFIRMGGEAACDALYRPHLMEQVLKACKTRREVRERLTRCPLFVGTVATLSGKTELFRLKHFDVAIVDEAAQILEPQLLGLLSLRDAEGKDGIGKFILIGDHKQLPAVVVQPEADTAVHSEALQAVGLHNLRNSLFERLYRFVGEQAPREVQTAVTDMLCRQGRMHEAVAAFPNHAFYEGRLSSVGLPHQQGELTFTASEADAAATTDLSELLIHRVAFLSSVPEADGDVRLIKYNHAEARLAARLAAAVYRAYSSADDFSPLTTLGIITPYRSQIALIRKELAAQGIADLNQISVDTVERYQGSERDVIIYSFCVNSAAQLELISSTSVENGHLIDRKLNVALTRARKQLFLTGVPHLLRTNPLYAALLTHLR
jgi:hypothetical protein